MNEKLQNGAILAGFGGIEVVENFVETEARKFEGNPDP